MKNKNITIFGTSKAAPGDWNYDTAYKLGQLLAEQGFTIVNGGYKGTMLAAAKGAQENNGKTIGVTCSLWSSKPNKYNTEIIRTDSLIERLNTLVDLADAYIVLPGSTGTLLELAHVWELKNKKFLASPKPLILAGNFWKPLVELIKTQAPEAHIHLLTIDEPEKICQYLNDKL